jgi:hypothetical protein
LVSLVGERYARVGSLAWCATPPAGSIFLGDQKLPITVPRVRGRQQNREVPLTTFQQFRTPRALDLGLLRRVLGRPAHAPPSRRLSRARYQLENTNLLESIHARLEASVPKVDH